MNPFAPLVSDDLHVDADIARARTLPGRVYTDPAFFRAQRDGLFARSWQLVGEVGQVRVPGRVVPTTLLPGCLDEPVVLVRGLDDELRCLSNVCTHRGALVVEGEGHVNHLRCRYHGRRFELDGRLRFMPEFEGVEGFPCPADDLPRIPVERWGPFLFASLDPAIPFDEWIAPVRARTDWMPLDEFRFDPATSRDYLIEANWALYCDNYLEEFHIPYIHGRSLAELDYESYRTERFRWGNLQFGMGGGGGGRAPGGGEGGGGGPALGGGEGGGGSPAPGKGGGGVRGGFDLPPGHPDAGEPIEAFYFWLFPNLMLNFYPWGLSVNVVQPLSHGRTRVAFRSWVWRDDLRDRGLGADLHRVEMEDEEVVESVQRGLASRLYGRGRFSPRREVGTHHFHQLLSEWMRRGVE